MPDVPIRNWKFDDNNDALYSNYIVTEKRSEELVDGRVGALDEGWNYILFVNETLFNNNILRTEKD